MQPAYITFYGLQELLYVLLLSYRYPLNMQNLWKYFNWVSLEFKVIPNIFQLYLMDMNQIKMYSYSENFQFLSK